MKTTKRHKILFSMLGASVLVSTTALSLTSCSLFKSSEETKNDTPTPEKDSVSIQERNKTGLLFEPVRASMARTLSVNVGQGDSEIIQISQNNTYGGDDDFTILIDSGTGGAQGGKKSSSPDGEEAVAAALDWLNVKDVDLFVISHPHNDHMYGLPNIIMNYATKDTKALIGKDAWDAKAGDGKGTTQVMKKTLKSLAEKQIPIYDSVQITNAVNQGVTKGNWVPSNLVTFVDNANQTIGSFSVLGCTEPVLKNGKPSTSMNAYSVSNVFSFNNHKELFAGDSEGCTDDKLLEYYNQEFLKSDVYKVSHHGSGTEGSNGSKWIEAISPTYAIISSGTEDPYTLPDVQPLKNLMNVGVKPENILGTQPFGKAICLAKQTLEPADLEKGIKSWTATDNFLAQHQTLNNNNRGGSVVYNPTTNSYARPTGPFVNLVNTTDQNWTNVDKYYDMVMQGVGIMINFGQDLDFNVDATTVKPSAWNPSQWDQKNYSPVAPSGGKWTKLNTKDLDKYTIPTITELK